MLANQSLLPDFGLVEELDEYAAETLSGGYELLTIRNKTVYDITHVLYGASFLMKPNETWIYTGHSEAIIEFDADIRDDVQEWKKYKLTNGVYEFQDDPSPENPYDIELYWVG